MLAILVVIIQLFAFFKQIWSCLPLYIMIKMFTCRRLQLSIDKLKQSQSKDLGVPDLAGDLCSETETEADQSPDGESDMSFSPTKSEFGDKKSEFHATSDHSYENLPLTSLLDPNKKLAKLKTTSVARTKPPECSPRSLSKSSSSQTETISRKRTRIILSDDEDENDEVHCSGGIVNPGAEDNQAFSSHDMFHKFAVEDVATSDDCKLVAIFFVGLLVSLQWNINTIFWYYAVKVGKKQCNHTHEVQVVTYLTIIYRHYLLVLVATEHCFLSPLSPPPVSGCLTSSLKM